jgi:hypothetical protein
MNSKALRNTGRAFGVLSDRYFKEGAAVQSVRIVKSSLFTGASARFTG